MRMNVILAIVMMEYTTESIQYTSNITLNIVAE